MDRIFQAGLILVIGAILLPVMKVVLDLLNETMVQPLANTTVGLTDFEAAIMNFYPLSLLVAVFVAAAMVIRGRKRDRE